MLRVRQQHPKQMKNYKSYKRYLRLEFNYACAYCELSERERGGSCNFGCDHYRPQSLFPEFALDYNNLLYACSRCNSFKGDFWRVPKYTTMYILNPFEHDIDKHINKSLPKWVPRTWPGYFTIDTLRLTSEGKIMKRENRALAHTLLTESKNKLTEALDLQKQAKERGMKEVVEQLTATMTKLRVEITFWEQQLIPELDND